VLPSRLRRWPIVGLLALLLLIAGTAILWLTQYRQPAVRDLVSYFPTREATVLYLDVEAIRASGILDKLVGSTVGEDPEYRAFIAQTGFDYKRDLNRVMMNSAGGIHYFVLQGRFDWAKLKSWAASQGGVCKEDYCHTKGSTPDRIISWRKLRSDMMALASARDEAGARAIDRRAAEPVAFDVPGAPLWLHVPGETMRSTTDLPAGTKMFASALKAADRAVFSLLPDGKNFALAADVACPGAEQAAVLKAQLEGLTNLLLGLLTRERKTPSDSDLSGVLTSGKFDRAGTHVKGRWTVQRAFLDALGGS